LRGGHVRHVEERDAEIDARERKTGIELQRASKRVRSFFCFELLEQRYADVVRAIRFFAIVSVGSVLLLSLQQEHR